MLKFADNPPITPNAPEGVSVFAVSSGGITPWTAAYTKPRQEKALAAELLHLGVPYFLPLVEKVTISGGRKRRGMHPLFASYLFFEDSEAFHLAALRTERIVQLVTPSTPEQPLFVRELESLEKTLLAMPGKIELNPRIIDGARARITAGAMQGFEGVVVRSERRTQIQLKVSYLGTSVLVDVESDLLEPR